MEIKDFTKPAAIIGFEATFKDAVSKMIKDQANALVVIDDEGRFAGEVNVSDLFDAIVPEELDGDTVTQYFSNEEAFAKAVKNASDKPIEEFLSHNAEPVHLSDSIINVAAVAISHQHSRIPVVDDDNRPVGIISRQGLKHIIGNYLGIRE